MSASPLQHGKTKAKRRSRGQTDSPKGSKPDHHWVPLSAHVSSPPCMVPAHKISAYEHLREVLVPPFHLEEDVLSSISGGLIVGSGRGSLYSHWTSLDKLDISEDLPIRADTVLLHPETMRAGGHVIASSVVVKGRGRGGGVCACGKVWPLPTLPLDVVGLGWGTVLGCRAQEGERVEVYPVPIPTSRVPIAAEVTLAPCERLEFQVDSVFTQYLLHMHDGVLITSSSCLGVQYLGKRRVFKVVEIKELLAGESRADSSQCLGELRQNLSQLSLNESEDFTDELSSECDVYKVTVRSKFKVTLKDGSSQEPSVSFLEVGGLEKQMQLLKEIVLHPLKTASTKGVLFPHGIILYGPSGVGKSLLAQALACEAVPAHSIHLSASQMATHEPENVLRRVFSEARENCPSLIIMDHLDTLCPNVHSVSGELEMRALSSLLTQLDDLHRHPPPSHITVLATTNQIDKVVSHLRRPGRFDKEVQIPVPSSGDREQILKVLLRARAHSLSLEQLRSVAEKAHGYVGADLSLACSEAQYKALHRVLEEGGAEEEEVRISMEDMLCALREIRPSAMKEVTLEVPKVLWSDIGGQQEVKRSMREAVELPITHPEAYAKMGIRPPRGVLLYGPPGCSKTMVARALATESGLNFMAVKGPELFSKWVGDSERAVRQVFSRARAAAPAIVFFDEIDALAAKRKNDSSAVVADRVLAQLLTEMDGVEDLRNVLVVAATNRPDMIDKALIRPGRIDELIYVPLPCEDTRREIFKIQFRGIPVGNDVVTDDLVCQTEGFSGAEVVSLCQKAAVCALREDVGCSAARQRHFQEALQTISPQTSAESIQYYREFRTKQKNIF